MLLKRLKWAVRTNEDAQLKGNILVKRNAMQFSIVKIYKHT